jgi:hypothetical protein
MSRINPHNPRTLYYNDSVAVGWVHGSPIVELAAEDPKQGVIFFTLDQKPTEKPQFRRQDACLTCHVSYSSLGVPGMLVRSVFPGPDGTPMRELGDRLLRTNGGLEASRQFIHKGGTAALPFFSSERGNLSCPDKCEESRTPEIPGVGAKSGRPPGASYPLRNLLALVAFRNRSRSSSDQFCISQRKRPR